MASSVDPDNFDFGSFGSSAQLEPISQERVEKALAAREWKYQRDPDGDTAGFWDNNPFFFLMPGEKKEILQIRGRWGKTLPIEKRADVLDSINEWHRQMIWPKAYVLVGDDGRMGVIAESAVDWEAGASDDQIDLTLRFAIVTTCQLFAKLNEEFPEAEGPEAPPAATPEA
jgi:hypothetical protein